MRADERTQTDDRPLLRSLIGAALRRARIEQERTLADVAEQARVSVPYLSEIERGRKEPSSEVLAAVCDALRIELIQLVSMVGRDLVERRTSGVVIDLAGRRRTARRRPLRPLEIARPGRSRGGDVTCLLAA